jgi:hypothetical protein
MDLFAYCEGRFAGMVVWWSRSATRARIIVVGMCLVAVMVACGTEFNGDTGGSTTSAYQFGARMKTSGCVASGGLPDHACTPGDIFTDATKEEICVPGYASSVRDVPQSVKEQVYAAYGITTRSPGEYEVDHLVNLSIGGSNDISNLWPEAANPTPGFHQKDQVEVYLQDQVCSGKLDLLTAQIQIASNWLDVYNKIK